MSIANYSAAYLLVDLCSLRVFVGHVKGSVLRCCRPWIRREACAHYLHKQNAFQHENVLQKGTNRSKPLRYQYTRSDSSTRLAGCTCASRSCHRTRADQSLGYQGRTRSKPFRLRCCCSRHVKGQYAMPLCRSSQHQIVELCFLTAPDSAYSPGADCARYHLGRGCRIQTVSPHQKACQASCATGR